MMDGVLSLIKIYVILLLIGTFLLGMATAAFLDWVF